jgi:hypothetical protein
LTAASLEDVRSLFLEMIGIIFAPDAVNSAIGTLSEYVAAPLLNLSFYIDHNTYLPTHGSHQFPSLLCRLGMEPAVVTKVNVDYLYAGLGIVNNVWASALREMIIDFGLLGADIALGHIVTLSRETFRIDREVKAGKWVKPARQSLGEKSGIGRKL